MPAWGWPVPRRQLGGKFRAGPPAQRHPGGGGQLAGERDYRGPVRRADPPRPVGRGRSCSPSRPRASNRPRHLRTVSMLMPSPAAIRAFGWPRAAPLLSVPKIQLSNDRTLLAKLRSSGHCRPAGAGEWSRTSSPRPSRPPEPGRAHPLLVRSLAKEPLPRSVEASELGAAYRNRTDDLRITRVSPCVARDPKTGASIMFAGS